MRIALGFIALTLVGGTLTACGTQPEPQVRDSAEGTAVDCASGTFVAITDPAVLDGISELTGNLDEWQGFSRSVFVGHVISAQERVLNPEDSVHAYQSSLKLGVEQVLWSDEAYDSSFVSGSGTTAGYRGFVGGTEAAKNRGLICAGDKVLVFAGDGEAGEGGGESTAYAVVPLSDDGVVASSPAAKYLPPEIENQAVDSLSAILAEGDRRRTPSLVKYLDMPLSERMHQLVLDQTKDASDR